MHFSPLFLISSFFFCRHGLTGGQREDAVILLPFFFLSFASFLPAAHRHAGRC
ncbi:hypothetical protein DAI22_08g068600 [Oryza sativa Japonica Group]|nr:hypothetical protein DAI22_08g068600 [Oryza sativa Japonica Group]